MVITRLLVSNLGFALTHRVLSRTLGRHGAIPSFVWISDLSAKALAHMLCQAISQHGNAVAMVLSNPPVFSRGTHMKPL